MRMAKQKPDNNTKEKLAGSHYFLEKMMQTQENSDAAARPYIFNFDAFLALFRAITGVMQTELANYPGFEEWYATQRKWMKADPQMRLLAKMRNIVLHQGSAPRKMALEVLLPIVDGAEATALAPTVTILDKDGNVVKQTIPTKEAHQADQGDQARTIKDVKKPSSKIKWYFIRTPEIDKVFNKCPDLDINSFLETDMITICMTCLDKLESAISDYFAQEPKGDWANEAHGGLKASNYQIK